MLNNDDCFIQNKHLLSVEIDDELVMISEDQENFISLNSTGKVIFDCLTSPKSVDDIIAIVCAKFAVDKAQFAKDVALFLSDLIANRVIHVC
ncbi:MAG: PqqD family protein [Gammaproteobacteria bacterium]|nr:PqqD family protein [Gammaproteobacteria bacterium]